jgi:hypothetical protein
LQSALYSSLKAYKKDYELQVDDFMDKMEDKISALLVFLEETLLYTREGHPDYSDTFKAVSEFEGMSTRVSQLQQQLGQKSRKSKK